MENPITIGQDVVTWLRDIPAVVASIGGVAASIRLYEDAFPSSTDLQGAIHKLPNNSILVVWQETTPEGRGRENWTHRYSLIIKAAGKYADVFTAIVNGVPSSAPGNRKFRLITINPSCSPISTFTCQRRSLLVSEQPLVTHDFFEVSFSVIEKGISA